MLSNLDRFRAPFDVLGLDPTASEKEINKQRRCLLLQVHPDKTRGDEAIRQANEAKAREYNKAHEEAISFVRDPWFQQIKHIIIQQKRVEEEHKRNMENIKREQEKNERRRKRAEFFSRVIQIISNHSRQHDDNYNDDEFKQKTGTWTAEQYQEANDTVQYGLSDSRKMLSETRCQLERAMQENASLREQIERGDKAASEVQPPSQEQLCDIREQHQREFEQAQMRFEERLKDMEIQLKRQSALEEERQRAEAALVKEKRDLTESLAKETRRADAEAERADAATAKLEEEKQCANAVKAELAQFKQRIVEIEGQSVTTIAEAKEWEAKCSALQEQLDRMLAQNVHEAQAEKGDSSNKKRRIGLSDQHLEYSNLVRNFVITHTDANEDNPRSFLSTTTLYEKFQIHYKDQEPRGFNKLHFATEFLKCVQEVHPNVSRSRNSSNKGYVGLVIK
jgi:curved DNA-binding protein CbpA